MAASILSLNTPSSTPRRASRTNLSLVTFNSPLQPGRVNVTRSDALPSSYTHSIPMRSSASSAQRKASLRAAGSPSAWSRVMWMSGTGDLLELFVPPGLGQLGQLFRRIIKPREIAALALEQGLEAGHEFVVGGLRAERGVVRLGYPAVVEPVARGIARPGGAHRRVPVAEVAHRALLEHVALLAAGLLVDFFQPFARRGGQRAELLAAAVVLRVLDPRLLGGVR